MRIKVTEYGHTYTIEAPKAMLNRLVEAFTNEGRAYAYKGNETGKAHAFRISGEIFNQLYKTGYYDNVEQVKEQMKG